MTSPIEIDAQDGILTLRFANPKKKNALTHAMYTRLVEGFDRAAEDASIRVVLVCGGRGVFTTGNDIGDFMANPPGDDTAPVLQFLHRLHGCKKPLVMAVDGYAIGVGATMLLHADVVIAGDGASFQMPFVNLGLVPEAASSLLLPRSAGHKLASEILLLGERFDAATAYRAGLVTRVVPSGEVEAEAVAVARKLASKPPEALALSKALIKGELVEPVKRRMAEEAEIFLERLGSEEAMGAFAAFMNRKKG